MGHAPNQLVYYHFPYCLIAVNWAITIFRHSHESMLCCITSHHIISITSFLLMVKSPMFRHAQNNDNAGAGDISNYIPFMNCGAFLTFFSIWEALLKQDMFLLGPAGPLLRHQKSANACYTPKMTI